MVATKGSAAVSTNLNRERTTATMSSRPARILRRCLLFVVAIAMAMGVFGGSVDSVRALHYDLLVSSFADRSSSAPLAGASVTGDIAVFVDPDTGITQVRFLLDGVLKQTEKRAPWDFAGTAGGLAKLDDTTQMADGPHTISAEIDLSAGGTEVVSATFTVANNAPALLFSPDILSFALAEGGSTSPQTVGLNSNDATVAAFTVSDDAPWLTVSPVSGSTPDTLSLSVDATGLAAGLYTATVTATASGYLSDALSVILNVGATYDLLVSSFPDRSSSVPLAGATVADGIAVFVNPDTGITQVRFLLDEVLHQTENRAPWDFEGTAGGAAKIYDTIQIADGLHTISAEIDQSAGGTVVVSANFTVANTGPSLVFSPNVLSFAVVEGGSTPDKTTTMDTNDATVAAYNVSDDAAWLTVSPGSGSTPDTLSHSVDATGLTVGTYTATVTATASSYLAGIVTVTLSVSATLAPDQVHLAWVGEPSTTLTVVWRTLDTATLSVVEYRPLGDVTWQSATGALRASGTQGSLHEVTLTSLTPSTAYEYRVTGDGSTFSGIFTARTAPPPGPADFDAVFVADTGLVGRADGLATGTQQVVDEIVNINPLLVLTGGDYAYFNTDTRFGSLDNTIDVWFNQMQPIGAQSPMMPTYGNHEVLLGEGFDAWAARFPTPAGFNARRNYSFDVGDVHFVSILAVSDTAGIGSTTLDWIQQDITAAQAAGKRWIVPYLHVSAFGDGTNHPDNETLRAQLGPLFESLGVKLVLSAQDQAFERTYPLTDVPATNTPTSTSQTCYTMSDGVTWAKISPGGKLSNINGTFSQFATEPAPAWTAYRDNTMHHFSRLIVSASGSIQLDTYGVVGDGTPAVILDSFQYVDGVCPPELRLSTNNLSFTVNEGETDSAPIDLSTSDATVADFTITDNASWLSISPGTGSTPDTLTASVDASALTAGAYTATATATAGGYLSASLTVNLDVAGSYNVFLSSFPDRSGPVPLDGQTVAGDIFVFTGPDASVDKVDFWVDDPAMTGNPDKKEARAPYDLAGSNSDGSAKATDSTQWSDGPHTVTASIALTDGSSVVVSATFTVDNAAPALVFSPGALSFSVDEGAAAAQTIGLDTSDGTVATYAITDDASWLTIDLTSGVTPVSSNVSVDTTGLTPGTYTASATATASGYFASSVSVTLIVGGAYDLFMSLSPDRSSPVALDGQTVAGDIFVFTGPDIGVDDVNFWVDDPTMSGAPDKAESNAPYDLAGSNPDGSAKALDSTQFSDGLHTVTASIALTDGSSVVVGATFTVLNNVPALAFTPNTLSFAVDEGATAAKATVVDTTDGTVANFTITDDAPWLTVSPVTGPTPLTLNVSVDATGLAASTYTATVTATAGGYPSATLTVTLNVGGAIYNLFLSDFADRSSAVPLEGQTASGDIHVFTGPDTGVSAVTFFVDDPTMAGTPQKVENNAPYDLGGTNPDDSAIPYATVLLADGLHTVTAALNVSGGETVVVSASFFVDNGCSPLPCSVALVDLPYELDYDHRHDHGGITDINGVGTGFTYIDQPTNGIGYIADNLLVDLIGGRFQITTTAGHADSASNSQDNALGVGIDAPSQISILAATLVNPPAGTGNGEQTGVWFGNDEDNYVKVVAVSNPGGTTIEYLFESSGVVVDSLTTGVLDLTAATVSLSLRVDPTDQTITAFYSIDGAPAVEVGSFAVPGEILSFDAAGIDPTVGTRSFGGISASHGLGPGPLVYTYRDFSVTGEALPFVSAGNFSFKRSSFPISFPTSIDVGPDGRIYVTELFGTIHALTLDANKQLVDDQIVSTLVDSLGPRLTLGITVDPLSTPTDVILWVSHSSPSLNNGVPNSGMVSRISGPGLAAIEHVITGVARAKANHATNSIDFGPDDRLYIAQGGNTGAGGPNLANTEFGDMEEQPLSAAILVADVRNPTFDGSCGNPDDIFGPPPCDVVTYATGLRNAYDFAFHSNGSMYAPDNGLGVAGTFPPSPTAPCFGLADPALHSPGDQPDLLFRIQEGGYYGHPNPYRDECVFKDGSFQGVAPLPNWIPPIFDLGNNRSANGTIEYTAADAFCGALNGDLLIANFSVGDNIKRITLSADGLTVLSSETLVAGLADPLPLAQGPDGTIYVGEFGADQVTALEPVDLGCWTTKQAVPEAILDAGGTALGGKLYMVGGKTAGGHVSTMYVYDPAADAWTVGPDLPGSAVENPAVAAFNGKVYAFGGSTAPFSGAVANAAVYDPVANSWTTLTPMNTARGGAIAQAIAGNIYVAGGMDSAGVSIASVEVYDPATDSWSAAAPMTTPRDNPGSAVLDGKLYIFGGRTRGVNDTLSSVEMYDPGTDSWTARAPMPTGRRTMVVGILNGRAQVMGGERAADGSAFVENEEYNPITNTWRTLTPMSAPRHGAAAGTINGVVYVAGGGPTGGLAFTDLVEAFAFQDP